MNSPALIEQLRFSHGNKFLAGKTLSRAVAIAESVGQLADSGKQYTINQRAADAFIGNAQVGEYILTGQIPARELIESIIVIKDEQ